MTAPVPRPAEEPDREALDELRHRALSQGHRLCPPECPDRSAIDRAYERVLALLPTPPAPDDDEVAAAGRAAAVQYRSALEGLRTGTPPAPGGGTPTCGNPEPHLRHTVRHPSSDTGSQMVTWDCPGGGGTDLRTDKDRLIRELDEAHRIQQHYIQQRDEALAALAARDADQGARDD